MCEKYLLLTSYLVLTTTLYLERLLLELTSILLLALEQKECGFSLVTYDLFVQDLCKKVDDQNRLNTVVVGVQQVRPPRLKIRKFLCKFSSKCVINRHHKK